MKKTLARLICFLTVIMMFTVGFSQRSSSSSSSGRSSSSSSSSFGRSSGSSSFGGRPSSSSPSSFGRSSGSSSSSFGRSYPSTGSSSFGRSSGLPSSSFGRPSSSLPSSASLSKPSSLSTKPTSTSTVTKPASSFARTGSATGGSSVSRLSTSYTPRYTINRGYSIPRTATHTVIYVGGQPRWYWPEYGYYSAVGTYVALEAMSYSNAMAAQQQRQNYAYNNTMPVQVVDNGSTVLLLIIGGICVVGLLAVITWVALK